MNKRLIIAFVSVFLFVLASNVSAVKPDKSTYSVHDELFVVGCGDYDVLVDFTYRVMETLFYDKDSVPVKLHFSAHVSNSVFYNSVDPDIFIQQGADGVGMNEQFRMNLITGEWNSTGAHWRITLPGIGPLFVYAGNIYFDGETIHFSGRYFFPEEGTGSALCEALAP